ncbi:predicted protein [Botrytis cinerea T4]|uniref:Uncharacterized protein n=1 Tax=Botryotinia fuckeliana (strain T4) TaxID=999810 RepID=G2XXE5_BOTF4|nr:predicted protein [Botrytis cinerea T4]
MPSATITRELSRKMGFVRLIVSLNPSRLSLLLVRTGRASLASPL